MAIENGVAGVTIKSKTRVFPAKAVEKKECPIVTFDLPYVTFFYNQKVLLYKGNSGGGDFEEMVGRLKDGLGVVLEYFYPLAGRLGLDEEGVLRVEKCGEEEGWVEVAEAVAHGVSVADLAGNEASALIQEIVPFTGILNVEGLHRPLLAVQEFPNRKQKM
ncbi:hypothetical protein ACLOJK_024452 [Asimina triloba]